MSLSQYRRLTRFLNSAMGFLAAVPALLLVAYYFAGLSAAWTLLPLFAAFAAAWALREFCGNFLLFAGGSLSFLAAALPGLLFHPLLFLAYLVLMGGLAVMNFTLRLRPDTSYRGKNSSAAWFAVPAGAQLACLYLDFGAVIPWILAAAVCQLLLRFLNEYLLGLIAFLEEVKEAKRVPLGQIRSSNGWLLSVFLLISAAVMVLSCFIPFGSALAGFLQAAGRLLRAVITFLASLFGRGSEQAEVIPEPEMPQQQGFSGMGEDTSAAAIWVFLERVMIAVFAAAVVVGGIALLLYCVYRIVKTFYSNRALHSDQVEFLNPFEKKEKLTRLPEEKQGDLLGFFGLTANARIRKTWYRAIKAKHRDRVPGCLAPLELTETLAGAGGDAAAGAGSDKAKRLAEIYDKARYSGKECSREEMAAVKELAASVLADTRL